MFLDQAVKLRWQSDNLIAERYCLTIFHTCTFSLCVFAKGFDMQHQSVLLCLY